MFTVKSHSMWTQEEKIIMFDSEEAATFKTGLSGWVSSRNHYFGNGRDAEKNARNDGSTHKLCDCGAIIRGGYSWCDSCNSRKSRERYEKLQEVEWDGITMLADWHEDRYFRDEDEVLEYCENNDVAPEELRLVLCEENHYTEVDVSAIAPEDQCPEDWDGDLPVTIQEALDNLNKIIREYKKPFSWGGSNKRVTLNLDMKVDPLND